MNKYFNESLLNTKDHINTIQHIFTEPNDTSIKSNTFHVNDIGYAILTNCKLIESKAFINSYIQELQFRGTFPEIQDNAFVIDLEDDFPFYWLKDKEKQISKFNNKAYCYIALDPLEHYYSKEEINNIFKLLLNLNNIGADKKLLWIVDINAKGKINNFINSKHLNYSIINLDLEK